MNHGPPRPEVQVFPNLDALSRAAAELLVRDTADAISRRGRFALALAGGSTPRALYQLLAGEFRARIDWGRADVFFGDERCVPPDDAASNFATASDTLLRRVGGARVHRIEGEREPGDAARAYDAVLRAAFPEAAISPTPGSARTFDVALLGVGTDGHTASLFPGSPAVDEAEWWAVAVPSPSTAQPAVPRVTLTLPVLNRSRAVYVLCAGEDKGDVVRRILSGEGVELPAARVRGAERTRWLLDRGAARAWRDAPVRVGVERP